jgi:stress response protein YsnF
MMEHLVAVFHDAGEANAAEQELREIGIPAESIRRYARSSLAAHTGYSTPSSETAPPSGFWAWLLGEQSAAPATTADWRTDESSSFDRRVAAGDTVLTVMVSDDSQIHRVVAILEAHHPIGIDQTTDEIEQPGVVTGSSVAAAIDTSSGAAGSLPPAHNQPVSASGEEVIPLAKEEVEIGKRTVDRGTTRVRRYVVETPVEREVTLRGERVTIERRHPTGVAAPSGGQFEERVVEIHETDEVPVVEKTAHVNEEVVVRREPKERTETVRDTVRPKK